MVLPRRRITKQLLCPVCGDVMATAVYTRFPWNSLVVTSMDGYRIMGIAAGRELRHSEERLEQATESERRGAEARLAFLREHPLETVYDLRCRSGHSTLRSMPQIVRTMVEFPGQWISPS